MVNKLKKVETVVENIMDALHYTRYNDDILYSCVCKEFNSDALNMSVEYFLKSRKELRCPSYSSVVRARRKIFNDRPELKPVGGITERRKAAEEAYREYAREGAKNAENT